MMEQGFILFFVYKLWIFTSNIKNVQLVPWKMNNFCSSPCSREKTLNTVCQRRPQDPNNADSFHLSKSKLTLENSKTVTADNVQAFFSAFYWNLLSQFALPLAEQRKLESVLSSFFSALSPSKFWGRGKLLLSICYYSVLQFTKYFNVFFHVLFNGIIY